MPRHPAFPVKVYTPEPALRRPGSFLIEMLADLWNGRELAWRLFVRDVSAKYRQTALGYLWAFLPPIATTLTFVLLNAGGITHVDTGATPYPAYVMLGMLLWQVIADSLQSPLQTVTAAKSVLIKVNLPREAILLSGLYMVGFNFLIRLALLVVVLAWFRISPPVQILLLPIGALALAMLGFMIGVALTPLGVLYQDVTHSLPIFTSLWLLLTPVAYPPAKSGALAWLATWNPASPLINTTRDWLISGQTAHLSQFIIITSIAAFLLFCGWIVFRLAMPHLIARMGG